MLHPSSLNIVTGLKHDEVHPVVKNPGTVVIHEDVVLLLSKVKVIRLNARPGTTATFASVARTSPLQCKKTSSHPKHCTFSFLPPPVRRKASAGGPRLLDTNLPGSVP